GSSSSSSRGFLSRMPTWGPSCPVASRRPSASALEASEYGRLVVVAAAPVLLDPFDGRFLAPVDPATHAVRADRAQMVVEVVACHRATHHVQHLARAAGHRRLPVGGRADGTVMGRGPEEYPWTRTRPALPRPPPAGTTSRARTSEARSG